MFRATTTVSLALVSILHVNSFADGLRLLPADTVLTGPRASQRLIVLAEANGHFVGDLTSKADFATSNPAVATVDAGGKVQPLGDGETTITATFDGKLAIGKVKV